MTEDFLQAIWKNRWFTNKTYTTQSGKDIKIHFPGYYNTGQGADFTEAKIEFDGLLWIGNIEIHVKASDWYLHEHHTDPNYNNVILHVVKHNDKKIINSKGLVVNTVEIEYDVSIETQFNQLINSSSNIACSDKIKSISSLRLAHCLTQLAAERMEERFQKINKQLKDLNNDWESVFYFNFVRSFGFGVNNIPFEQLSKSTPIIIVSKHCGNLNQIEALLMGQAGFLHPPYIDDYHQSLATEYSFLQNKFSLKPMQSSMWRFMRIRPANFPTLRIAQLSSLLNLSPRIFEQCIQFTDLSSLQTFLTTNTSLYWESHYVFGKQHDRIIKHLGAIAISLLIINAILPVMFAYGKVKAKPVLCERALNFLEEMNPEQNNIIKQWTEIGITPKNALESQALIELETRFCQQHRCIKCNIGQHLCQTHLTQNKLV
jgi:hypothetical protein